METFGGAFSDVESMSRIQTTTDSIFGTCYAKQIFNVRWYISPNIFLNFDVIKSENSFLTLDF